VKKYSDQFMDWLVEAGYTHCFFVAGGNAMHLIESASSRFTCIPSVHEVGAGVAADFFNEICRPNERAFVIVTAGPGITNTVTAIASAWIESRELLVIGGQAKSTELARRKVRQFGFQEVGGVDICSSITKASFLLEKQMKRSELFDLIALSKTPRKGPVFIEFCLDISMQPTLPETLESVNAPLRIPQLPGASQDLVDKVFSKLQGAKRPLFLIGAGIDRAQSEAQIEILRAKGLPIATSFNGADRVGSDYAFYCGRPNWYGSRWANLINQQADLVICLGTRLGIVQTGYNWDSFVPKGEVVQVDLDHFELEKGTRHIDIPIQSEANDFLNRLCQKIEKSYDTSIDEWQDLITLIRTELEMPDKANSSKPEFLGLYNFVYELMKHLRPDDVVTPSSSGGSYESFGRVMLNLTGQKIVTSHGLASMGFGLTGGIGMAFAYPERRTVVLEGDGGFAQNLQELGVVRRHNLNMKIFIMDNGGYASIRANQKSAFNNHYIGCDRETGLWFPQWELIGKAFDLETFVVNPDTAFTDEFMEKFNSVGPVVFVVKNDPDQVAAPRISSRISASGKIESNPLHKMEPPLTETEYRRYAPYLPE
jgi:acetolactate synthase-1/2/3 large subunit